MSRSHTTRAGRRLIRLIGGVHRRSLPPSFGRSVFRPSVVRPFCRSAVLSFGRSVVRPFRGSAVPSFGRSRCSTQEVEHVSSELVRCCFLDTRPRISQQSVVQLHSETVELVYCVHELWSCFAKFPGVPRFCHLSARFVVLQNDF